jgi:glycosyltransferase involved in cell wall biosynthesis
MTIYEALCTRTPVVASDHPMFLKRLVADWNGLIFRAADPASLADAVERLRTRPDLYRSLSANAGESAEKYLLPLKWHMLLDLWLRATPEADEELGTFSLARRSYD